MSAPRQTPSGQGNPTSSPLTLNAPFWMAYLDLKRLLVDFPELSFGLISWVENEQFQDGSLDNFVSDTAHIGHVEQPDLGLIRWLGCQ